MAYDQTYTIVMGLTGDAHSSLAAADVDSDDEGEVWTYFEREIPNLAQMSRHQILAALSRLVFGKKVTNGAEAARKFKTAIKKILDQPRQVLVDYAKNFGRIPKRLEDQLTFQSTGYEEIMVYVG